MLDAADTADGIFQLIRNFIVHLRACVALLCGNSDDGVIDIGKEGNTQTGKSNDSKYHQHGDQHGRRHRTAYGEMRYTRQQLCVRLQES